MATWYTNTPKSWKEKGWSGPGGEMLFFLKVSVFNQVIFISSFVVRVQNFGLQRQVKKNGAWGGEFFSLACKVQNIINEDVILKGGVNYFFYCIFLLLITSCNLSISFWISLIRLGFIGPTCDRGRALVHFSNECHSGLWFTEKLCPFFRSNLPSSSLLSRVSSMNVHSPVHRCLCAILSV